MVSIEDSPNMRESKNDKMKLIQDIELELLDVFIYVVDKLDLTYYLCHGTLLGAVRHKGFIPWDDDIDIVMPRKDYERFVQYAIGLLPDHIELSNYTISENCLRYVTRLYDLRTKIKLESYSKDETMPIWLDIFPLDGMPKGVLGAIHKIRITFKKGLYYFSVFDETVNRNRPGRPFLHTMLIRLCELTHIGNLFNPKKRILKMDKAIKKYDYDSSELIFQPVTATKLNNSIWAKAYFDKGILLEFEGRELRCPSKYHEVLTIHYGDYMTLPPEDKRTIHNIEVLEYPNIEHE